MSYNTMYTYIFRITSRFSSDSDYLPLSHTYCLICVRVSAPSLFLEPLLVPQTRTKSAAQVILHTPH